jgi:DNA-binding winged helix-turn-helix (wHTH) protein
MRLNHSGDKERSFDVSEFLMEPRPTRWVASRKAAVVLAIRSGLISTSDASERYLLSANELAMWHSSFDGNGRAGLLLKSYSERLMQARTHSDHWASRNKAPQKSHSTDPMRLTRTEKALLEILTHHKGIVVSKDELFYLLYRRPQMPSIRIIDVLICNIRRKLRKIPNMTFDIKTVWGRGYILCALSNQSAGSHQINRTARGSLLYNGASQGVSVICPDQPLEKNES